MSEAEAARDTATNHRWWEGYLVRYLIGMPIGVVCVVVLSVVIADRAGGDEWSQRVLEGFWAADAVKGLALLVAGGLYCYLASAPITVIHASRMFNNKWFYRLPRYIYYLVAVLLLGGVLVGIFFRIWLEYWLVVLMLPGLLIMINQWICVFHMSPNNTTAQEEFRDFYWRLSCARSLSKESGPVRKDFRESYTHLREHSNSIFIVILELSMTALLCGALLLQKSPARLGFQSINELAQITLPVIGMLTLWLFPNVFLWSRANHLERHLINLSGASDIAAKMPVSSVEP